MEEFYTILAAFGIVAGMYASILLLGRIFVFIRDYRERKKRLAKREIRLQEMEAKRQLEEANLVMREGLKDSLGISSDAELDAQAAQYHVSVPPAAPQTSRHSQMAGMMNQMGKTHTRPAPSGPPPTRRISHPPSDPWSPGTWDQNLEPLNLTPEQTEKIVAEATGKPERERVLGRLHRLRARREQ